ncbi:5936_t:CDS:2 [Funneliformis geosporum]|nr:5936_t:CDS:2 [Funneliformis geosporum]
MAWSCKRPVITEIQILHKGPLIKEVQKDISVWYRGKIYEQFNRETGTVAQV